jgi:Mrp family chromosome partitioning ATPase
VMQKLSLHFDWILIDSPPLIPLTDALSLGRQANGSLLVARAGRTPSDALEKAIALLGQQHVIGVVLNGVEEVDQLYSGYYESSGGNNGRAHRKMEPIDSKTANRSLKS